MRISRNQLIIFTSLLLLVSVLILGLPGSKNRNALKQSLSSVGVNDLGETTGQTTFQAITASSMISLPYLHCGHTFYQDKSFDPTTKADVEIVLLHGAKFTKANWKESGILESLCALGNVVHTGDGNGGTGDQQEKTRRISVTALDLSVKSTALELNTAVHALHEHAKILSGRPTVIVTPSASGKAMVELAQLYRSNNDDGDSKLLKNTVSIWITVASPAVLSSEDSDLKSYQDAQIPVLAINGDQDKMGKKVTKKLVQTVGAEGLELKGGHPCYLDSPDDFVEAVLDFVSRDAEGGR